MDTRDLLVRKYVIDIIFIIVVIALLTWFWFGPYQHKVRIKESLKVNDVYFNNDNLQPIDKNSYICSGNLFFQNAVNEPISFKSGNFIQPTINNSLIKDSAQNDIKQDPYKNSILQD